MSYYFVIVGTRDNPLFEHEFGTSKAGGDGVSRFREDARRLNQFIVHSSLDLAEEAQWTTGAMYLRTIDRFYNSHVSLFQTGARAKFLLLHNPDPASPANAHLYPFSQPATGSAAAAASAADSARPSSLLARPTSSSGAARSGSLLSTASTLASSGTTLGGSATTLGSSTAALPSTGAGSKRQPANPVAHSPGSPQAEEATRQFFAEVYESWVKAVMSPFYTLDDPVRSPAFRQRVAAAAKKYL